MKKTIIAAIIILAVIIGIFLIVQFGGSSGSVTSTAYQVAGGGCGA